MTNEVRMPSTRSTERGFTLTEIAIVLGIIGLILGAIWVAAAAVYTNLRSSKATTELLQITQAVRALYATSQVTGDGDGVDEINGAGNNWIRAGIFPVDTLSGAGTTPATATKISGPWTGSYLSAYSLTSTGGVAGDAFSIGFGYVPSNACVTLILANAGVGRDPGLLTVVGGQGAANTPPPKPAVAAQTFPLSTTQASTLCGVAATGSNVSFIFKLHA